MTTYMTFEFGSEAEAEAFALTDDREAFITGPFPGDDGDVWLVEYAA